MFPEVTIRMYEEKDYHQGILYKEEPKILTSPPMRKRLTLWDSQIHKEKEPTLA